MVQEPHQQRKTAPRPLSSACMFQNGQDLRSEPGQTSFSAMHCGINTTYLQSSPLPDNSGYPSPMSQFSGNIETGRPTYSIHPNQSVWQDFGIPASQQFNPGLSPSFDLSVDPQGQTHMPGVDDGTAYDLSPFGITNNAIILNAWEESLYRGPTDRVVAEHFRPALHACKALYYCPCDKRQNEKNVFYQKWGSLVNHLVNGHSMEKARVSLLKDLEKIWTCSGAEMSTRHKHLMKNDSVTAREELHSPAMKAMSHHQHQHQHLHQGQHQGQQHQHQQQEQQFSNLNPPIDWSTFMGVPNDHQQAAQNPGPLPLTNNNNQQGRWHANL